MQSWTLRIDKCRPINWPPYPPHIYSYFFSWWFAVHQRDKQQLLRPSAKSKRPLSLERLAGGKERERVVERGWRVRERGSAESDQYSNCKMNLTGARTSHQMGKEIGYERWPAIKSDIPQCHLSDSGWGIMTAANESWALVRRWFKSAPCCGRLTVLTQCPIRPSWVPRNKRGRNPWHYPKLFQAWARTSIR